MKKLLLCTAALTMFAGSALALNNSNVKADDGNNSNTSITNTLFSIDNNNNSTIPVDPFNQMNELQDPANHNVRQTNAKGELTLDAVPNELKFGKTEDQSEKNDGNTETLETQRDKNYYYAQVTDNRQGAPGWTLSASMSPMTANGGKTTLKGANIIFNSDSTSKPAYKNFTDNASNAPTNATPASLQSNQGPTRIMYAEHGKGAFTWFDLFNSVQLKYGQSYGGDYTGTITWRLENNVANNGVNLSDSNPNSQTKSQNTQISNQ